MRICTINACNTKKHDIFWIYSRVYLSHVIGCNFLTFEACGHILLEWEGYGKVPILYLCLILISPFKVTPALNYNGQSLINCIPEIENRKSSPSFMSSQFSSRYQNTKNHVNHLWWTGQGWKLNDIYCEKANIIISTTTITSTRQTGYIYIWTIARKVLKTERVSLRVLYYWYYSLMHKTKHSNRIGEPQL